MLGGLILLPYIIPEVVRALAWRLILDPLFGAQLHPGQRAARHDAGQPWLGDPHTALPSVIMVNVWAGLPFFIILLLAGLKAIDAEQYDAASVDGATAGGGSCTSRCRACATSSSSRRCSRRSSRSTASR